MEDKIKKELIHRLDNLLTLPLYKLDPKDQQWYMTNFTKEQMFTNLKECQKLIKGV